VIKDNHNHFSYTGEIKMIWTRQFALYIIIGLTVNGLGFLFFAARTWLGLSPEFSISILSPVYIVLTFIFNKSWSFNHQGRISTSAIRYLTIYVCCYILNVAVLKFSGYLGYSHLIMQAVAMSVFALLLFLAQKYWVFRNQGVSISHVQAL
jgi:putative flippase GtrA